MTTSFLAIHQCSVTRALIRLCLNEIERHPPPFFYDQSSQRVLLSVAASSFVGLSPDIAVDKIIIEKVGERSTRYGIKI